MERDLKKIISEMTLEEKAGMCSGEDFWRLKKVERLGIPEVMVSDGPHGLRKQPGEADHLGIGESIVAVCFPAACATASSFDTDLMNEMGKTLGEECQAENLSVLLGPAVNIKRSPLCGRNFEYLSEDPYLAGKMAASYIRGVQSWDVGTSMKHYAANNQEYNRMSCSSNLSERTFREIYLPTFETAVKAFEIAPEKSLLIGKALKILADKAGIYGMVGGQVVDVASCGIGLDEGMLNFIYELKTGALIESSMMIGALLAGADEAELEKVQKIASDVGIAFQIQDDILDVTSTTEELGKPVHSDEKNEKTTYVTLKELENLKE